MNPAAPGLLDELAGSRWAPAWFRRRALGWLGYRVLHEGPLADGRLRVLERGSVRRLRFGDAWEDQSAFDLADPLRLLLPYTRLATVGLALPSQLDTVLHIGLGGATLPRVVDVVAPRTTQHAVEPYAEVVDVARRYFALPERVAVTVAPADAALPALDRAYDLVFLDAFSPAGAPMSQSAEAFARLRRLLRADGWLVVNATDDVRGTILALNRAFASVAWLRIPDADQYVVAASDAGSLVGVRARAAALSARLGFDVEDLVDALEWSDGSILATPPLG
ncbi:MAG: MnmC family methyltransferase [Pseudomonadota bacterium]|nr:MnmC family methyltransferase [Pseudomonadota bacterium]